MGELAAIVASLCWAYGSVIFTFAARKIGAPAINRLRLLFAMLWVILLHLALTGRPFPTDASWERWLWLGLSGVIGLAIGDLLLYYSFLAIGPRISSLVASVSPILSAVLAWLLFHETLRPIQILGVAITLAGVTWVVVERTEAAAYPTDRKQFLPGVLCAVGGAACQAVGLVMTKEGLTGNYSSVSGLAIRMLAAMLAVWIIAAFTHQALPTLSTLRHPKTLGFILAGSLLGPFIGVWLSLVAVQRAPIGIASTLMSLSPLFLIPISIWAFKERITLRAILGTLISIVGVVILFS